MIKRIFIYDANIYISIYIGSWLLGTAQFGPKFGNCGQCLSRKLGRFYESPYLIISHYSHKKLVIRNMQPLNYCLFIHTTMPKDNQYYRYIEGTRKNQLFMLSYFPHINPLSNLS